MRAAWGLARLGLAARTGFYLVLAYLCALIAWQRGHGPQANAHGALALVTRSTWGSFATALAAAGFAGLGLVRLAAAVRDRDGSWWQRTSSALQGLFYLLVCTVPLSFLLGHHATGSEQQQHDETARALSLPGGRALVFAAGVVVIVVSGWQIRTAARTDFTDGMDLRQASPFARRAVAVTGRIGIAARALVFAPVGGFLIAAALAADPGAANGLDTELADLAKRQFGPLLLGAVTAGLLVFAVYSGLETRYREVSSSR